MDWKHISRHHAGTTRSFERIYIFYIVYVISFAVVRECLRVSVTVCVPIAYRECVKMYSRDYIISSISRATQSMKCQANRPRSVCR